MVKPAAHRGMRPRVFNLAFPSAALPASGSLGIISARYFKAPLVFWTMQRLAAKFRVTNFLTVFLDCLGLLHGEGLSEKSFDGFYAPLQICFLQKSTGNDRSKLTSMLRRSQLMAPNSQSMSQNLAPKSSTSSETTKASLRRLLK